MKPLAIQIAPSARALAGFNLMAAFWPHRMETGGNSGQNPAIDNLATSPQPLQTTLFREVTCSDQKPVVLS